MTKVQNVDLLPVHSFFVFVKFIWFLLVHSFFVSFKFIWLYVTATSTRVIFFNKKKENSKYLLLEGFRDPIKHGLHRIFSPQYIFVTMQFETNRGCIYFYYATVENIPKDETNVKQRLYLYYAIIQIYPRG